MERASHRLFHGSSKRGPNHRRQHGNGAEKSEGDQLAPCCSFRQVDELLSSTLTTNSAEVLGAVMICRIDAAENDPLAVGRLVDRDVSSAPAFVILLRSPPCL
jgi:hypothetical protein